MCREIPGEENFRLLHSDVREPFFVTKVTQEPQKYSC